MTTDAVPGTVATAKTVEVTEPEPIGAAEPDAAPVPPAPAATFRIMEVVSVAVELPEQYPSVVLEDIETGRRRQLSFRIGVAEGVALAHALAGTRAPRPLTCDLFGEVLDRFGIDVAAVRLVGRQGTTYLAQLDLVGPQGREILPCRPSDGIALALRRRLPAPVLADERLLSTSGDVGGDA